MASGQPNKFQMLTAEAIKRWLFTDNMNAFGVGFYATDALYETIADGETGAAHAEIDLGANFKVLGVICEDCQFIAQATNLSAQIAFDPNGPLCDLYEQDDPGTAWAGGVLPTAGTLAFILTHTFGARKIRLILSNAASGGSVIFRIFGFHSGG